MSAGTKVRILLLCWLHVCSSMIFTMTFVKVFQKFDLHVFLSCKLWTVRLTRNLGIMILFKMCILKIIQKSSKIPHGFLEIFCVWIMFDFWY